MWLVCVCVCGCGGGVWWWDVWGVWGVVGFLAEKSNSLFLFTRNVDGDWMPGQRKERVGAILGDLFLV